MNTCKDCKWWGKPCDSLIPDKVPFKAILEFKQCENPHFIYGPGPAKEGPSVTPRSLVYSEILDDYNDTASKGEVITGPDFGCVHWEKKDE